MRLNRISRRIAGFGPQLVLLFSSFAWGSAAQGSEALFGYVYTTDLEPKGELEMEQWITDREGQAHGRYHNLELRTELEYGVTDRLSVSGYLNYSYISASRNSVMHATSGLGIPADHDPTRPYNALRFDSFSAEMVYRVLSPYTDPIGLALYVEPEIGPDERAIEFKVIAQKNFLDDRMVLAANVSSELERETGGGEVEKATALEFTLGLSYRFAPKWFAGIEFRNHNEFKGYSISHTHQEHTALFIGPTVHYASQRWWATLTVLTQFYAAGYTQEQRDNILGNRIYGDEHTRIDGIRLKAGFDF